MTANPRLRCFLNVRVAPRHPPSDGSRYNRQLPPLPPLYPLGQRNNDYVENGVAPIFDRADKWRHGGSSSRPRDPERQHSCVILDAGTEAFE
jgi:hypothetical protein